MIALPSPDTMVELFAEPRHGRMLARVEHTAADQLILEPPGSEPLELEPGQRVGVRLAPHRLLTAVVRERLEGLQLRLEITGEVSGERRRFLRCSGPFPARFTRPNGDVVSEWFPAQALDVSGGGLCLIWREALPEDADLRLEVDLAGEKVHANGRVLGSRAAEGVPGAWRVVVEFDPRLAEEERGKIVRFVHRQEAREKGR